LLERRDVGSALKFQACKFVEQGLNAGAVIHESLAHQRGTAVPGLDIVLGHKLLERFQLLFGTRTFFMKDLTDLFLFFSVMRQTTGLLALNLG
jgi:hypothetical protein